MLQSSLVAPISIAAGWPEDWLTTRPMPVADDREVDVLIATYNRCPFRDSNRNPLAWMLDSLWEQQQHRLREVVVVDDASTDHTPRTLETYTRRWGKRLRVIRNATRQGSSEARNLGLLACTAELVFVCDDDCQLTRHALHGLHRTLALQQRIDSRCAAVHLAFYQRALRPELVVPAGQMGSVDASKGRHQTNLRCFPQEYLPQPQWQDESRGLFRPLRIQHLCGIFLADRAALVHSGGFPSDFRWPNAFCEELELSFRLLESGHTLYHQPDPRFFAVHYKYGWTDPAGLKPVNAEDEFRCFGTRGEIHRRNQAANQPRLNTGNRVNLHDWCYSKLISYFVCFGRRSLPGAFLWMERNWQLFVRQNAPAFYGCPGHCIADGSARKELWKAAFEDGMQFLTDTAEEHSSHVEAAVPLAVAD